MQADSKKGKRVAIVAMGDSSAQYLQYASSLGARQRVADEVWAINSMGGVIQHDLLFHMDDCRIQEARAARKPDGNVAGMLGWLKLHPKFITSVAYPEYAGAIEFPLQKIINTFGCVYFNNTAAYAVAYAMYCGVDEISLYGFDYHYANSSKAESGRGCVEHWLGLAFSRGIQIVIANSSSLMDSNVPPDRKFYGYDALNIEIKQGQEGVILEMKGRDKLPSAEEIEIRYKHEAGK